MPPLLKIVTTAMEARTEEEIILSAHRAYKGTIVMLKILRAPTVKRMSLSSFRSACQTGMARSVWRAIMINLEDHLGDFDGAI